MGKYPLATFVVDDRNDYVLVMLDWQHNKLTEPMSWYPTEKGGVDFDRAAIQDGYRIFIFGDRDWLRNHPEMRRFCIGDRTDFDQIASTMKYHWSHLLYELHDPISHLRKPWRDSSPIAEVSRNDFHAAFGEDACTSRFPRER